MMKLNSSKYKIIKKIILSVLLITLIAYTLQVAGSGPAKSLKKKYITVYARQWEYIPNVIEVDQGDEVVINLISLDVSHGMFIEGYEVRGDILLSEIKPNNVTISFIADKPGTYIFRCSVTCGPFHPFMTGKLVVRPNTPLLGGISLSIIIALGVLGLLYIWRW